MTGTEEGIFYLHADHLGRPQFATDSDGAIVWDMGEGVTPFGEGVNLAGAFAQRLMFPGQYADEETGEEITLSHNWHRTYDPTLGRYLQSDPIGLAGGLNRYVYGLGDPVSNIDPDGRLIVTFLANAAGYAFPDFLRSYNLMGKIKKEVGWINGTDKWVHCLANCDATNRGKLYGRCGAATISYAREAFDFPKNILFRGMSLQETVQDFHADNAANIHGRKSPSAPGFTNCRSSCSKFRPATLPSNY